MFYNLSWDTDGTVVGDKRVEEETKRLIKKGLLSGWKKSVVEAYKDRVPWNKGKKLNDESTRKPGRSNKKVTDFTVAASESTISDYKANVPAYELSRKRGCSHHTIL